MIHFELENLDIILSALQELSTSGQLSERQVVKRLIERVLQMPVGEPLVTTVIMHPYVLRKYGESIVQRIGRDNIDEERTHLIETLLWKDAEFLRKDREEDGSVVRVRRFRAQEGYYYGFPFHADDGVYTFWNDEPVLLTRMAKEWREELFVQTELGWLSRPEVRILAALSFSASEQLFCFQVLEQPHDLPTDLVLDESETFTETALRRAQIADRVLTRIEMYDHVYWAFRSVPSEFSPYRFVTEGVAPERTQKLYEGFDIRDNLALRTAFLLIKAASLWSHASRTFGEDATASLFFGLEGCLRLIHRRISKGKNFELKPTIAHIEAKFPHMPGYVWMLEDAYEKRIQIVHPEPRKHIGWLPNLMAEDFFENYVMATDLFYYAITGETLPDGG
jgi:hypothetical protein